MKIKANKNPGVFLKNPKLLPALITNELSTVYPKKTLAFIIIFHYYHWPFPCFTLYYVCCLRHLF
jgi:hypothetical protein